MLVYVICLDGVQLVLREVSMAGEDLMLELGLVFVPKLSGLTIEWTRATSGQHASRQENHKTYLFGSPNKLWRLNSTLCTL